MIDNAKLSSLKSAKAQYDYALKHNVGVTAKRQILCNILLTHAEDLIETALDAQHLLKTTADNNKMINSLRKQIAELENKEVESENKSPATSSEMNG